MVLSIIFLIETKIKKKSKIRYFITDPDLNETDSQHDIIHTNIFFCGFTQSNYIDQFFKFQDP